MVIERGGVGVDWGASGAWMDKVVAALGLVLALVASLGLELTVWGHFGHSEWGS